MFNSLNYLYVMFIISIIVLISAFIIHLKIMRLQNDEAKITDGLLDLRRAWVRWGYFLGVVLLTGIASLTIRFAISGDIYRWVITTTVFVFSLGFLSSELLLLWMYQAKFPDDIKELLEENARLRAKIKELEGKQ